MTDTVVKIKRSGVVGRVPSAADLERGELAVNLADSKIFSKDDNDNIVTLNPDVNNITNNLTLPYDWGSISDSDGDEYDMGLITDPNDAPENAGFNEVQAASLIINQTLTFPTTDGVYGQVLTTDGSGAISWVNSATAASWTEKTSNYSAAASDKIIVDTSSQAIMITLPANPTFGDEITIIDGSANAETNNITINRNTRKIEGLAEDMTIDVNGAAFNIVYYNSSRGWILTER